MTLKVTPILPAFGAECSGLDLTRPLSPDEVRQVTDAMDRWGITVWRDTGLTDEGHVEFSRNFGYLEKVPKRPDGMAMRLPYRELFDASNLNLEGDITRDPARDPNKPRAGDALRSAVRGQTPAADEGSPFAQQPGAPRPRPQDR